MPKTKIQSKVRPQADAEFLLNAPELSIFVACLATINELRALVAEYDSGELSRIALSRRSTCAVAELSELANATERFDIVCPVFEFGVFSPFFWRWFNWWSDFLHDLTPRQVARLERLACEGVATPRNQRPPDHWLEYRNNPAFSLVINS